MSDIMYKIIAREPDFALVSDVAEDVVEYLKACVSAESIAIKLHGQVVFIDCGGNLERITCPICGAELNFEWWGEAMEQAAQNEFEDLKVTVPCCNWKVSLNELEYELPCGFGRWEIAILNPLEELQEQVLQEVELRLGVDVRVIVARY